MSETLTPTATEFARAQRNSGWCPRARECVSHAAWFFWEKACFTRLLQDLRAQNPGLSHDAIEKGCQLELRVLLDTLQAPWYAFWHDRRGPPDLEQETPAKLREWWTLAAQLEPGISQGEAARRWRVLLLDFSAVHAARYRAMREQHG